MTHANFEVVVHTVTIIITNSGSTVQTGEQRPLKGENMTFMGSWPLWMVAVLYNKILQFENYSTLQRKSALISILDYFSEHIHPH